MRRPASFWHRRPPFRCRYTLIVVRRLVLFLALAAALACPTGAWASLSSSLKRQMRGAGAYSGALVVDATTGKTLFSWKPATSRVLASNTKLFTTATALARFGV